MIHFVTLYLDVGDEIIKVCKGANSVFFSFTCAILTGSRGARIEVYSPRLLVFLCRSLSELEVALEEIVITTPEQ